MSNTVTVVVTCQKVDVNNGVSGNYEAATYPSSGAGSSTALVILLKNRLRVLSLIFFIALRMSQLTQIPKLLG